jgi:Ras-related protein Rab-1A
MNKDVKYEYNYKILLLGDSSVGKTCLLLRYSDDTFMDNHISTIGLDYRLKIVNISPQTNVKLQLWDSAGQDRFKAITKNYYKGAHGIVLIYDITSELSFMNIKNWISQIREYTNDVKIILVGNKIDLPESRVISYEEGSRLAKDYKIKFFECSAKNNIGVADIFSYLVDEIYEANKDIQKESGVNVSEKTKDNKDKKCC